MPKIELVLTDFDGTVAEVGKHVVSQAVRDAVIACEDSGIATIPVTGRYYHMARPILEILGFDGLGIFDNGATIQNCVTGEVVWSAWMPTDLVQKVAKLVAPHAYWMEYTPEHDEHVVTADEVDIIDSLTTPAPYVYALVDNDKLDEVKKVLDKIHEVTYYTGHNTKENVPQLATGVQINLATGDKYHGAKALQEIIGVTKQRTLAIGDGNNDIALFENAELKIAMGNATNRLKQKADYIVGSVQDDGFVEAMNRFVLNK